MILIAYPFHAHHQLLCFPGTNFKTDPGKLSSCIDLLYGVFSTKDRFFFSFWNYNINIWESCTWISKIFVTVVRGLLTTSATWSLYVPFYVQGLLLRLVVGWKDLRLCASVCFRNIQLYTLEESFIDVKVDLQVLKILHFGVLERRGYPPPQKKKRNTNTMCLNRNKEDALKTWQAMCKWL